MIYFERIDFQNVDWDYLGGFQDRMICQSRAWLAFIAEVQGAEPVITLIRDNSGVLGSFSGLIVKKSGLRMFGSPFPGWTSNYMGFNLVPGIQRSAVLNELSAFIFDELKCVHFELMDRRLVLEDAKGLGFQYRLLESFELDLTQSEETLWSGVKNNFRRKINKARKLGVTIELSSPKSAAEEFYSQLEDVFAKQSIKPTYGLSRVKSLIKHLDLSGDLVLMRALAPEGNCVASIVFPGNQNMAYFWGGASWRNGQHLCPNELLTWEAILHWKAKGTKSFDFGGGGEYKRKYGGKRISVPWFRKSKYAGIELARRAAIAFTNFRQRL